MNILIVEDETDLGEILQDYLASEGFSATLVSDGEVGLQKILTEKWDLVLLDLMLPKRDGLSICQEVRKTSQVPIIMTTAKVEEIDRLLGLELGADDYICKPFSPREVVARVKAGKVDAAKAESLQGQLTATLDWSALQSVDVVIEAVFEDLAVKQSVFRQIDAHAGRRRGNLCRDARGLPRHPGLGRQDPAGHAPRRLVLQPVA